MQPESLQFGQRIRVNVPGIGDHGQTGTIKKILGNRYYVHLDWDEQPQHRVLFYAADLDLLTPEREPVTTPSLRNESQAT